MGAGLRVCGIEGAGWVGNNGEAGIRTEARVNETPPQPHFIAFVNWSPDLRSHALPPFLDGYVCALLLVEGWVLNGRVAVPV